MKYEVTYTVTTEYIVEVEEDTADLARDHAETLIGNWTPWNEMPDTMDVNGTSEWKVMEIELLDEEEEN